MAPKGKEHEMASIPKKERQGPPLEIQKAKTEELANEDDATGETHDRCQPLREIVGDQIGVVSQKFFPKCKIDIINSFFDISR